jgi:sensor histidine kinase regulating citrate/malate metabolism
METLGREMLTHDNSKSNGIGLYLTRLLLKRMDSRISFSSASAGFQVRLEIPGRLEGAG